MKYLWLLMGCASLGVFAGESESAQAVEAPKKRPNILMILADDLGYSDIGSFGGEIATPVLDELAFEGVRFISLYTAPTCSPTRAMLLTGADNHLVGLGAMAEQILPSQKGKPGYEGVLNRSAVTIATRLREVGYHTIMAGKWHLGLGPENNPKSRGFERSFALLEGGATHFSSQGLFPFQDTVHFSENGTPVDWPEGEYSTTVYTRKIVEYLEESRDSEAPFFAYLSLTAPHWPLQAPLELIKKYSGAYDTGWDNLRDQRIKRLAQLGIAEANEGMVLPPNYRPWNSLSGQERTYAAREMEIYAAMVDGMDVEIGKLRSYLEEAGLLENTVIIFLSDNGAEGMELDKMPGFDSYIEKNFDNRLGNLGRDNSYVMYGPEWAHAASAPSRHFKGHVTEGGIKVPAFIWSRDIKSRGTVSSALITVKDVAATVVDLANAEEVDVQHSGATAVPMSGKTIASLMDNSDQDVHAEDAAFGLELYGKKSLRQGRWKLLLEPLPFGSGKWELFDLQADPMESNDLSIERPQLVEQLTQEWERYAATVGVVSIN